MFEKYRVMLAPGMTMENHPDVLSRVYGDRAGFLVEEEIPYSVFPGGKRSVGFREWCTFIHRLAHVLRFELGIKRGDRVAVMTDQGRADFIKAGNSVKCYARGWGM